MGARESAETREGLRLIAAGTPVREAARLAGVDPRTLTRAKKRAEMAPGKAGRPAKTAGAA